MIKISNIKGSKEFSYLSLEQEKIIEELCLEFQTLEDYRLNQVD